MPSPCGIRATRHLFCSILYSAGHGQERAIQVDLEAILFWFQPTSPYARVFAQRRGRPMPLSRTASGSHRRNRVPHHVTGLVSPLHLSAIVNQHLHQTTRRSTPPPPPSLSPTPSRHIARRLIRSDWNAHELGRPWNDLLVRPRATDNRSNRDPPLHTPSACAEDLAIRDPKRTSRTAFVWCCIIS